VLRPVEVVFLLDVDNTLFDNDQFIADLSARFDHEFGETERRRYWTIFEQQRDELGIADYFGALQKFRTANDDLPALLRMSAFLLDYSFQERLYPRATEVIKHLRTMGPTVILSDGDIVFQPHKIQRSSLWDAVNGQVLVYQHKEQKLDQMQIRFPARHYVMIDDKPYLLAAMKRVLAARLTTVLVRQGHYAADALRASINPPPDVSIACIGALCDFTRAAFDLFDTPLAVKEATNDVPNAAGPKAAGQEAP
jgi:FMN phosphatase YigB (HAD superfamily)